MGDMGDHWRDVRIHAKALRAKIEPGKKEGAKKELLRLGWVVEDQDEYSFLLEAPNKRLFKYWPFREFYQEIEGKEQGHGFKLLRKAGNIKEASNG